MSEIYEIHKLLVLTDVITTYYPRDEQNCILNDRLIDLDLSNDISRILGATFHYGRKKCLNLLTDQDDYTVYMGMNPAKLSEIFAKYRETNDDFVYPVAKLYLYRLIAFEASFTEIGICPSKMLKRINLEKLQADHMSGYGLRARRHGELVQGINFPPAFHGPLAEVLDDLTVAICLIKETREGERKERFKNALLRKLHFLPMNRQIVDCFAEATDRKEVKGLLQALADLEQTANENLDRIIFYPLLVFKVMARTYGIRTEFFSFYSGEGIVAYNSFRGVFTMRNNALNVKVAQVVFHAMFGTSFSMGLNPVITDRENWYTREDVSKVFWKSNFMRKQYIFPIKFTKFYSRPFISKKVQIREYFEVCMQLPSYPGQISLFENTNSELQLKFTSRKRNAEGNLIFNDSSAAESQAEPEPNQNVSYDAKTLENEVKLLNQFLHAGISLDWRFFTGYSLMQAVRGTDQWVECTDLIEPQGIHFYKPTRILAMYE